MDNRNYGQFALMLAISFVIMYTIMFLNVFELSHIYISLNRLYMTLLMVSPMALLMMFMMRNMYGNKKLNILITAIASVVFVLAFAGLRTQSAVGDVQYMRGMIPHHSSAILTSTNAKIKDPEVRKLADDIIKAQKKEIAQMKTMLQRLEK
ncbi:DUF305 domain-containing protein [Pedobacter endophyticus]|uniref:DUF305 domain-containing protein n=2 Tax=Pedobacter endophyticus TaxID=2789740 RepID=A0A7S9L4D4_9SPHI|nr:DUF305 domain-containing protein [Pedobacter endophyticus]